MAASLLLVLSALAPSDAPTSAGVAEADITPPIGWRLHGSYTERIGTGVHDPLRAKAVVFRDDRGAAALVACDVCGIPRAVSDRIRDRASRRLEIPREAIVVLATHSHGGPLYYDLLRDIFHERAVEAEGADPHEPIDYVDRLVDRCVEALAAADRAARPARLEVGATKVPGIAFNRRYRMRDGSVRFNPGKGNPEIVGPAGPVNEEFPILLARDSATGEPFASLSTFAMHVATFGGPGFGADFPGVLQARLRERFGPGFISVFAEGAAGDINHIDVSDERPQTSDREPGRIGAALADRFLDAVPDLEPVEAGLPIAARSRTIRVPLRPSSDDEHARSAALFDQGGETSRPFLEVVEAYRHLAIHRMRAEHGLTYPVEVQAIRLGDDAAIATLPHEVFVELGMAIEQASPFRRTFVFSLANDYDVYVPTRRAYAEGSYEVTNTPFAPGSGEAMVEAAADLLRRLGGEEGAPRP